MQCRHARAQLVHTLQGAVFGDAVPDKRLLLLRVLAGKIGASGGHNIKQARRARPQGSQRGFERSALCAAGEEKLRRQTDGDYFFEIFSPSSNYSYQHPHNSFSRTTGPMRPAAVDCTDQRSSCSLLPQHSLMPWHRQRQSQSAPAFEACRLSMRAEPAACGSRAAATIHLKSRNGHHSRLFAAQRQCRRQTPVGVAFDAKSATREYRAGISVIYRRRRVPKIGLRTVRRADARNKSTRLPKSQR